MLNVGSHSTFNIQHSTFNIPRLSGSIRISPPELDACLRARSLDHVVRLFALSLTEHLQDTAREDAIEQALAIGVRRQDALRIGAKAAEEVVDLRVFAADEF